MPAEHLTPASSSPALQISSSPAQPANYNDALQFKTQCKWRKVKQLQLSILQLAPAQVSGSCKTTTMLSSSQWRKRCSPIQTFRRAQPVLHNVTL